jgi:periplasmic protein TonB
MTATLNTFPALNTLTSPRSWVMAVIVLLHLGFFWALSNGLSLKIVEIFPPPLQTDFIETKRPPPPERPIDEPTQFDRWTIVAPTPDPRFAREEDTSVTAQAMPEQIVRIEPAQEGPGQGVAPIVVEPTMDHRYFSEPIYPAAMIRQEKQGTVMLSVRVGANGRVLEVRLDESSGHPMLDESAIREARRWRFAAGTQDGQPTPMWTQIPVKFRLK